jgi:hypothetical protein
MPWIMQMLGFALFLLGIGIALWVSLWLLVILFAIGLIAVIWSHLRGYLLRKGILNPTPGIPPSPPEANATVIEGNYTRVESGNQSSAGKQ